MKDLILSAITTLSISFASFAAQGADAADTAKLTREEVHATIEACRTENNLTRPEPGQRPSDADRALMDTCLKAKGVDITQLRPPGPPHRRAQDSEQQNCNQEE